MIRTPLDVLYRQWKLGYTVKLRCRICLWEEHQIGGDDRGMVCKDVQLTAFKDAPKVFDVKIYRCARIASSFRWNVLYRVGWFSISGKVCEGHHSF